MDTFPSDEAVASRGPYSQGPHSTAFTTLSWLLSVATRGIVSNVCVNDLVRFVFQNIKYLHGSVIAAWGEEWSELGVWPTNAPYGTGMSTVCCYPRHPTRRSLLTSYTHRSQCCICESDYRKKLSPTSFRNSRVARRAWSNVSLFPYNHITVLRLDRYRIGIHGMRWSTFESWYIGENRSVYWIEFVRPQMG